MSDALQRHWPAIGLAVLLLTGGGIYAATRLPVSLFPVIDYPRVVVSIDAGERDAAAMAAEITRPAEIALRAVPGATGIRSTTSRGAAEVALRFAWGEDMVSATLATQAALAGLLPDLPSGARFEVRRSDPTLFPVFGVALTSDSLSPAALRQIAELQLLPLMIAVDGVAGVDILGSAPREFEVNLDPARLAPLNLTLADVATSLAAQNTVTGVGRLEDRHQLYLVLVDDQINDLEGLRNSPVAVAGSPSAGIVRLGDIATISSSLQPVYTRVNANGRSAVLLNVRQALAADTVALVRAIQTQLSSAALPKSVIVTSFYDQSELVVGAANAVRDAILIGAALAGLVLFVFLRSWRLMVITGLVLPAVLVAACIILLALGMSFNMMTLGGMAAAVGLIVDDAVVMLEHMIRRIQEGGEVDSRSLLASASEMAKPLFGSTCATIIVFLPLALISGVTGGFFKALAVTMTAALLVSMLYARFLIPLLASRWLGRDDAEQVNRGERMMKPIVNGYSALEQRVGARPWATVLIIAVGLSVCGYLAFLKVPSGFMPRMDEGGFILDYRAPPGTALVDTDAMLRQVETIISGTPEVSSYSRRTGVQLGGGLTEADEGDYFIRLHNGKRRGIESVMSDVRRKIAVSVPSLEIETAQLMEDLIGDLTAVPQPIEIKLFSSTETLLRGAASKVGTAIAQIDGIVEVVDGLRVAGSAITIQVDRGSAVQAGLDPQTVAQQISALVGGAVATQVRVGEQLIAVRVRAPQDLRERITQLGDLRLGTPDGHEVTLRQIATIEISPGQEQLTRENLAPFIGVTARLEGRDLGSAMAEVKRVVVDLNLGVEIRVEYGGLFAQAQQSFRDLAGVFIAALLLVLWLLTALFRNLYWSISAVATVLLAAAAVLIGLWLTGIELNIAALMGLTMVVGMVTELVIFYLAELDSARNVGRSELRVAGVKRLRPILMSALIAILTLLPLALGISRGAGLQQPLATAIIFGLVAAVPLVLLFLPAMLALGTSRTGPSAA